MLRNNDLIQWNKSISIRRNLLPSPYDSMFDTEPNCIMEVKSENDGSFSLDCVKGCGAHEITNIYQDQLDVWEQKIGDRPYHTCNVNEMMEFITNSDAPIVTLEKEAINMLLLMDELE